MKTNKMLPDSSISKVWENFRKMNGIILELPVTNWVAQSNGTFTNTVEYEGFTSDEILEVDLYDDGTLTEIQISEYDGYITEFNVEDGKIVAVATTQPTQSIKILARGEIVGKMVVNGGGSTDGNLNTMLCPDFANYVDIPLDTNYTCPENGFLVAKLRTAVDWIGYFNITINGNLLPHSGDFVSNVNYPFIPVKRGDIINIKTPSNTDSKIYHTICRFYHSREIEIGSGSGSSGEQNKNFSKVLLWENDSPTTAMAGKTVTMDLSNYNEFIIVVRVSTANTKYGTHIVTEKNIPYRIGVLGGAITYREITFTNNGFSVNDGTFINPYETVVTNNEVAIPVKIYGKK